jgi:hypothetical protein
MKYRMLTVENEHAGVNRFNQLLWLCKCDCGATTLCIASSVRTGKTKSCGCLKVSGISNRKHGQRSQLGQGKRTKAYSAWCGMKQRCDNPNNPARVNYGGRGIKYDPRWKNFEQFYEDMGSPTDPSFSLDRIDNDGDYEKSNCRWCDNATQRRNKRPESRGGRLVWCEIDGERMILADAVKKYQVVPYHTAVNRIYQGWTPEKAVMTPYTRGFSHAPKTSGVRYDFNGKSQTLSEWSLETGIGRVTMLKRIQRGVPLELALTVNRYLRC